MRTQRPGNSGQTRGPLHLRRRSPTPMDLIRHHIDFCCALRIAFPYTKQLTYARRRVKHLRPLFERRPVFSVKTTVGVPTTTSCPRRFFVLLVYSITARGLPALNWRVSCRGPIHVFTFGTISLLSLLRAKGRRRPGRSRSRLPACAHHFPALCRRGDLGRDQAGDRHPEG